MIGGFSLFGVFFVALIVVGVVLAILAWQKNKKRREALRVLAAERRWHFIERDVNDRPGRFIGFEPFGQGHTRYASNIMSAQQEDGPFEVFDYHYAVTTSTGKSTTTQHYHFKIVTLVMPLDAPGLLIKDEHLGHKILKKLGRDNISFESDEFSRRFWVRCPDRRFAYDMIDPATMEYLMTVPGWTWEWRGRILMMQRTGKLQPDEVDGMLGAATRFRALLPRHRLAEAKAAAASGGRAWIRHDA